MRHTPGDLVGPVLCGIGAVCMIAAAVAGLDTTAAKALMICSAVAFVPGAWLTLAFVRRHMGPPR